MSPAHAIVFDFDGVIADSEPVHERALLETIRQVGMAFSHEQYTAGIIGLDDRDAFPVIFSLNNREFDPSLAGTLADAKTDLLHTFIREGRVSPYSATLSLAQRAKAAGTPIAICSGALRDEIGLMLDAFGASDLFQIIVSADDVPKAKPDPEGYTRAASLLGVAPGSCACIEDTPRGIAAARAAGYARIVGVCHSLDASELYEADAVFATSADLSLDDLLG